MLWICFTHFCTEIVLSRGFFVLERVDYHVVNLVLVSSIERVLGQLVDVSVWKERPSNDKIKGGLDVQ